MICLAAGGMMVALALDAFTLAWTHSVQKSEIQEDYVVRDGVLVLVQARIKGSAAGFDPPPGAELAEGWWRYRPDLPPLRVLRLARSEMLDDWRLCAAGRCRPIGEHLPATDAASMTLGPCAGASP